MSDFEPVGPTDRPTELFVAPSDEAEALLRLFPGLVAQAPDAPPSPRRHLRDALVAPFTQLTFLSFDLQAFLFGVFHTTRIARVGHLVGMAGVNLFLMAGFSQATAAWPSVNGGAVYAAALLCWYAALSRDARLSLWWFAMIPVVLGLHLAAEAWLAATGGAGWASPWLWMGVCALGISLSHAPEPRLPPRAADPLVWMSIREFVLGPPSEPNPPRLAVRRALRVFVYPFIGALDELWASPRLLPYNVLEILFALGYAPAMRATLHDRVERALASGNPAIDYVGIGGGAVLARRE